MLISVIIATYNRCDYLGKVLEDLLVLEKDPGFNYEVIVVDNNSSDATPQVVESFAPRFQSNGTAGLRYLMEKKRGKSNALNAGIGVAAGEILAFTDDDVSVEPSWLIRLAECYRVHGCDGVGGRVLPVYPENTPQWIKDHPEQLNCLVVRYDCGDDTREYHLETMGGPFIGANYSYKAAVFKECGLFRTDLFFGRIAVGEDTEFNERLLKHNKKLYYCGKSVVHHPVELKRARLPYVARWHIAQGIYLGRMEREQHGHIFRYFCGFPRYIVRDIAIEFFLMVLSSFQRMKFRKHYASIFRYVGRIKEYRDVAAGQPKT